MEKGEINGSLFDKLTEATDQINTGDPRYMIPDGLMAKFQGLLGEALRQQGITDDRLDAMVDAATRMRSSIPIIDDGSLASFVAEIVSRHRR